MGKKPKFQFRYERSTLYLLMKSDERFLLFRLGFGEGGDVEFIYLAETII
jgi:hypothetical protein